MKRRIHAVVGLTAMTLVGTFMLRPGDVAIIDHEDATIVAEVPGDRTTIVAVKTAIVLALSALIPSVVLAGATGRSMAAGGHPRCCA